MNQVAAVSNPSNAWLALAVASSACAAFNGVFAKLTTTSLTASWSHALLAFFHFAPDNNVFELAFRGVFFLLNLLFNAVMWGLFTRALTLASSSVRVSIINTSTNFLVTAGLGAVIFSESLPTLWWFGAAMLVAGSVIIGRREEKTIKGTLAPDGAEASSAASGTEQERARFLDNPDAETEDGDTLEMELVSEVRE